MAKYIDKFAVMAEIESYINSFCDRNGNLEDIETNGLTYETLYDLKNSIDTLEVKEVDLEKESELIANEIMIGVQANKYHTNIYNTNRNDFNHSHLCLAARKGIELGMQQSKNDNNNEE